MINCEQIQHAWLNRLLNEDSSADSKTIEQHISKCAQCSNWARETLQIKNLARQPLSLELKAPPLSVLEREISTRKHKRLALISLSAAAAVVLLTAIFLINPFTSQSTIEIVKGNVNISDGCITTDSKQEGTVKIFNRSVVQLAPQTEIIVDRKQYQHVIHLNQGSATVEVSNRAEPFQVKTPVADISVLGTKFQVKIEQKGGKTMITVLVLAGIVQVTNTLGQATAKENEIISAVKDEKPIKDVQEKCTTNGQCLTHCQSTHAKCVTSNCKICSVEIKGGECTRQFFCNKCATDRNICEGCGRKVLEQKIEFKKLLCKKHLRDTWTAVIFRGECTNCKCKQINPDEGVHDKPIYVDIKHCFKCANKESKCFVCGDKLKQDKLEFCLKNGKCDNPCDRHKHPCWVTKCSLCDSKTARICGVKTPICKECGVKKGLCTICGKKIAQDKDIDLDKQLCGKEHKGKYFRGWQHASFNGKCELCGSNQTNPKEGMCLDTHVTINIIRCLGCAQKENSCFVCGDKLIQDNPHKDCGKNGGLHRDMECLHTIKCKNEGCKRVYNCHDKENGAYCKECAKKLGICPFCNEKLINWKKVNTAETIRGSTRNMKLEKSECYRITSNKNWRRLWDSRHERKLPCIDFEKYMVVAYYEPSKPTLCHLNMLIMQNMDEISVIVTVNGHENARSPEYIISVIEKSDKKLNFYSLYACCPKFDYCVREFEKTKLLKEFPTLEDKDAKWLERKCDKNKLHGKLMPNKSGAICKRCEKDKTLTEGGNLCEKCLKELNLCPICEGRKGVLEKDKKWIKEGIHTDDNCNKVHGKYRIICTCPRCDKDHQHNGPQTHSLCSKCADELGICWYCLRKKSDVKNQKPIKDPEEKCTTNGQCLTHCQSTHAKCVTSNCKICSVEIKGGECTRQFFCNKCATGRNICKGCGRKVLEQKIEFKKLLCKKHLRDTWTAVIFRGECTNCKCKQINPDEGVHDKPIYVDIKHCFKCANKESKCFVCGDKLAQENEDYHSLLDIHLVENCIKSMHVKSCDSSQKACLQKCNKCNSDIGYSKNCCKPTTCKDCAKKISICPLCNEKLINWKKVNRVKTIRGTTGYMKLEKSECYRITNKTDWQMLWIPRHEEELPYIDFEKYMVVAYYEPSKPTLCHLNMLIMQNMDEISVIVTVNGHENARSPEYIISVIEKSDKKVNFYSLGICCLEYGHCVRYFERAKLLKEFPSLEDKDAKWLERKCDKNKLHGKLMPNKSGAICKRCEKDKTLTEGGNLCEKCLKELNLCPICEGRKGVKE